VGRLDYDFEAFLETELGQEQLTRILDEVADDLGSERRKKALNNVEVAARSVGRPMRGDCGCRRSKLSSRQSRSWWTRRLESISRPAAAVKRGDLVT
jgi:hypothetical protein